MKRKVVGKNIEGDVVVFESMVAAAKAIGSTPSSISDCCYFSEIRTAKCWQFMYKEDFDAGRKFHNGDLRVGKIETVVNIETGYRFPSAEDAVKHAHAIGWRGVTKQNIIMNIARLKKSSGTNVLGKKLTWMKA